jgi:phosphoglycerol transferase MdoB-like AlkP superfamily enzyme
MTQSGPHGDKGKERVRGLYKVILLLAVFCIIWVGIQKVSIFSFLLQSILFSSFASCFLCSFCVQIHGWSLLLKILRKQKPLIQVTDCVTSIVLLLEVVLFTGGEGMSNSNCVISLDDFWLKLRKYC